jgi:hypothetical protein
MRFDHFAHFDCFRFYLRERFDDASLDTIRDNDVMWVYEMAPTPAEPPTQAPVAAEPPPEHIETFPSMAVDGESNTDEVYTGDFQADEKHEAAAHQAASSEASTAQPGDSSQLAVPSKILMLSDALIKQAMDTYACYICHQATTSDLICAHKYCDDDCLVCLECMAGPNMPVTTRAGMDYAVCPQCLHEGEEKEWPVLFEYITGMSPPASPLLNARRSAAASSPRIPPPVPPRRPKVFKNIVASFIHRRKEVYSSYAQPLGIPFVLALPNMGLTAGMLIEAVKDYLLSRGVLLHVTTDEANRFHDEETPAQLGPYSIIPLTDDGCCRRCVKLSTGYGKYSSCTGCSPLSEHDELDPLDQCLSSPIVALIVIIVQIQISPSTGMTRARWTRLDSMPLTLIPPPLTLRPTPSSLWTRVSACFRRLRLVHPLSFDLFTFSRRSKKEMRGSARRAVHSRRPLRPWSSGHGPTS